VDWGVAGAVLVASAWLLLGLGILKTWPRVRPTAVDLGNKSGSNKFAFLLGASLGLVAILVHSMVDFNMHIPANAIVVVTLMALLTSQLRFATDRFWFTARIPSKVFVSLGLLAGVAYLTPQAWRRGNEYVWLQRANAAPPFSTKQIDLLKHAAAIEPDNPKTCFAIGEALRHESQEGGEYYEGQEGVTYRQLAEQAMRWYQQAMNLNPYDSRNFTGYGWCLDQLDRTAESAAYFDRAEELDPNNYFNLNNIGLHYVQLGDFAAARPWFERSIRMEWQDNPIPRNYLPLINSRLMDATTNQLNAVFSRPGS
jgi:tetratricopeptide (TPR) repeat protein